MTVTKIHILNEIKRTAADNDGKPLGAGLFSKETGIKKADWFGVHWARWGDAVREAGFEPNQLQGAYDKAHLLRSYAKLVSELGRIPAKGDLKLKRRRDPDFPGQITFARVGKHSDLLKEVSEFCRAEGGLEAVIALCDERLASTARQDEGEPGDTTVGYVYLMKHGSRREYRIGATQDPIKRHGELRVQLPERLLPVHVIETDDPFGIEAYWQRRFAGKRKNGDWFELDAADVAAFRKRRFM